MKLENEIKNQMKIIRKIYDNTNGTFSWDDMKSAIIELVEQEKLKLEEYLKIQDMHDKIYESRDYE